MNEIPLYHEPAYVGRYLDRSRNAFGTLPPRVSAYFEREEQLQELQERKVDPGFRHTLAEIQSDIEGDLASFAARRDAEQTLAAQVRTWSEESTEYGESQMLRELADRLSSCRQQGTVGVKPDGGYMIAWDNKCGQSKLCPDEERQEQRRLDRRYVPHMVTYLNGSPFRRAFYLVFTLPNCQPGELAATQKQILDDFKTKILNAKEDIPPAERTGRRRKRPVFDNIHGALCTVESPLAASRTWNVHLNVILLTSGAFDFQAVRAAWGHNVEIRQIEPDAHGLASALREVVKYSAQLVPTKSAEKAARHETNAPPMVEWSKAEFVEWWASQKGFRRTRTYKALYKLKDPDADLDLAQVRWCGKVALNSRGEYWVDLILEDNFFVSRHGKVPFDPVNVDIYDAGPDPGG